MLKGVDDYMNLLDEHITMTQAMTFSTFKGPFEERIENWNNTLQARIAKIHLLRTSYAMSTGSSVH